MRRKGQKGNVAFACELNQPQALGVVTVTMRGKRIGLALKMQ